MSSSESESNPENKLPQNRILSIDGGGIRGLISIQILLKMERELAEMLYRTDELAKQNFRLCHYFNFIGGTSVGSIIASMLATGYSMKEVETMFEECSRDMFRSNWISLTRRKYRADPLEKQLRELLSHPLPQDHDPEESEGGAKREPILLGDPKNVKTLLMIMLRNASTGSNWPLTNNPEATYNNLNHPDCNLEFPLWQLVRASTAAPAYFPVEKLAKRKQDAEGKETKKFYEFVDGGVSPHNNPALAMFLHAVLPQYKINMGTGQDRMLIVSVGTGHDSLDYNIGEISEMHLLDSALFTIKSLMHSTAEYQDLLCRVLGHYVLPPDEEETEHGKIDRELNYLISEALDNDSLPSNDIFGNRNKKLFTYLRYNPKLTKEDAAEFRKKYPKIGGFSRKEPFDLDALKAGKLFKNIGAKYAQDYVSNAHFAGFENRGNLGRTIADKEGIIQELRYQFDETEIPDESVSGHLTAPEPIGREWEPRATKPCIFGALCLAVGALWQTSGAIASLVALLGLGSLLVGGLLLLIPRGRLVKAGGLLSLAALSIGLVTHFSNPESFISGGFLKLGLFGMLSSIVAEVLGRPWRNKFRVKKKRKGDERKSSDRPALEGGDLDGAPKPAAGDFLPEQSLDSPNESEVQSDPATIIPLNVDSSQSLPPPHQTEPLPTAPNPREYSFDLDPEQGIEISFQKILAGSFRMGARGYRHNEEPIHLVTIPADLPNNGTVVGPEFYSGNSEASLQKVGWYEGNAGGGTHPVGQFPANLWGLHDMHGNVWEWCHDVFDGDAYRKNTGEAPVLVPGSSDQMAGDDRIRVFRGGSWDDPPVHCRSAVRVGDSPVGRGWFLGFRVCLVPGSGGEANKNKNKKGQGTPPL